MTTPERSIEEQECECCGWDDNRYQHEPFCPLFAPQDNMTTPEKSVEEIVEEAIQKEYPYIDDYNKTLFRKMMKPLLQAERQKREETVEKWNELYGNAKYSPEMVLHEFNVFIQPNNPK